MSRFLITIKPLDGEDRESATAIATTVDQDLRPGVPTHPIAHPPVVSPPIYFPPHPTHPIVIPPPPHPENGLPTHPIWIPGHPSHPIVFPPVISGPPGPWPQPPIVIPPIDWRPGVPVHPIVLPPTIWPDPGMPSHPIVIPPLPPLFPDICPCPPHVDNALPGGEPGVWGPDDPRPDAGPAQPEGQPK